MTATKPVLIVGAGPTGVMAAIELNRFGIPVRLIDKLLEPATTSRVIGVQARTLELFEQRGLADAILEVGNEGNAAILTSAIAYSRSAKLATKLLKGMKEEKRMPL